MIFTGMTDTARGYFCSIVPYQSPSIFKKQTGRQTQDKGGSSLTGDEEESKVRVSINHDGKFFTFKDTHAEVLPKYICVPWSVLILAGGGLTSFLK